MAAMHALGTMILASCSEYAKLLQSGDFSRMSSIDQFIRLSFINSNLLPKHYRMLSLLYVYMIQTTGITADAAILTKVNAILKK
jgi:hypothetical protein